jgi:hypothetical protein
MLRAHGPGAELGIEGRAQYEGSALLPSLSTRATRRGLNTRSAARVFPHRAQPLPWSYFVWAHQWKQATDHEPRPFLVPLCSPPLLVITGNTSAEASFQCRLRKVATNRARFYVAQRTPISEDDAVCAQIKPDTVSASDPVKLFPTCRVDKSLGMFCKPNLK